MKTMIESKWYNRIQIMIHIGEKNGLVVNV